MYSLKPKVSLDNMRFICLMFKCSSAFMPLQTVEEGGVLSAVLPEPAERCLQGQEEETALQLGEHTRGKSWATPTHSTSCCLTAPCHSDLVLSEKTEQCGSIAFTVHCLALVCAAAKWCRLCSSKHSSRHNTSLHQYSLLPC